MAFVKTIKSELNSTQLYDIKNNNESLLDTIELKKGLGYKIMVDIMTEEKYNKFIGSIIQMKKLLRETYKLLDQFMGFPDSSNNFKNRAAMELVEIFLSKRDVKLPNIMRGRVATNVSSLMYNHMTHMYGCLVDDLKTFWGDGAMEKLGEK